MALRLLPVERTARGHPSTPDHTATWGSDPDYTHYVSAEPQLAGWLSTYNGYIGDVFVYKVALSDAERQQLETDITSKLITGAATTYPITATAGAGRID